MPTTAETTRQAIAGPYLAFTPIPSSMDLTSTEAPQGMANQATFPEREVASPELRSRAGGFFTTELMWRQLITD
ncbi:hypothetical protein DEJ46_38075 [Streptomyces venezuelae]|uniref:Uncharacterized protein n=1 Tax=Streptomyces venezuelae TaxID=54571 RepID=A0A5P2B383_STRVZ|nr:hypothetical protein DEJ46_38075 [Streptomyces venezuelae]